MAFAKLSGSLLVCEPPARVIAAPGADARPVTALASVTRLPVAPPPQRPGPARLDGARLDPDEAKRLAQHLKALRLPAFLGEHDRLARELAAEGGGDFHRYLLRLAELELGERKRRSIQRRIKAAHFPAIRELDEFDLAAIPAHTRNAVQALADGEFIARRENVIAVGNSGTGKTHLAIALGLVACRMDLSVGFVNAASLVHELIEASHEHRLSRLQRRLGAYRLLIVDDLGYVSLPTEGAELLFQVLSERRESGATIITSSLPTAEWGRFFGGERLTGALLERLAQWVHFLDMSGSLYRRAAVSRPIT